MNITLTVTLHAPGIESEGAARELAADLAEANEIYPLTVGGLLVPLATVTKVEFASAEVSVAETIMAEVSGE